MKEKTFAALKTSMTLLVIAVCFSFNSSSVTNDTQSSLDKIIAQLVTETNYKISLCGHTDNVGPESYNDKLSESRVMAVRNYLVSRNIDSMKISVEFKGEKDPLVENNSEENRAMNRRVEIWVSIEKNNEVYEKKLVSDSVKVDLPKQADNKTAKQKEMENSPVKTKVKKKKVRRRLVWTGWRTGFHWSTSGK